MEAQPKLYWHFATADDEGTPRLGYGDNRQVRVGETLRVEGTPVPCEHGLHASGKIWDALRYARGEKLALCRVTLGGEMVEGDDKVVASERTVLAMLDAAATAKLLRDFARWCALQVIDLWDAPDVVHRYLETGDESLRDATKDAAGDAAWDAAGDAAGDAAVAAAKYAVKYVARDAAKCATRGAAAAGAAAWTGARAAAWVAAAAAAGAAAGAAAAAAAGAAVWAIEEYAAELERRAVALFGE